MDVAAGYLLCWIQLFCLILLVLAISAIQGIMSRYQLEPKNKRQEVYVGWDAGLCTFYGQVLPHAECDSFDLLLWIGTNPAELTDLTTLIQQLAPYAEIPSEVLDSLKMDCKPEIQ